MSNLIEHAKRELLIAGYPPVEVAEEGPDKWIQQNVLELLRVFSAQGHSGGTAPVCVSMFHHLALFKPLAPLTGEDSEWEEGEDGVFQNKRCSWVFKSQDRFVGQAYNIRGRVYRQPDGVCYTNENSTVLVTFPYTPTTTYVDVPDADTASPPTEE